MFGSIIRNVQQCLDILTFFIHKPDQGLHIWNFPLSGPWIILMSIFGSLSLCLDPDYLVVRCNGIESRISQSGQLQFHFFWSRFTTAMNRMGRQHEIRLLQAKIWYSKTLKFLEKAIFPKLNTLYLTRIFLVLSDIPVCQIYYLYPNVFINGKIWCQNCI